MVLVDGHDIEKLLHQLGSALANRPPAVPPPTPRSAQRGSACRRRSSARSAPTKPRRITAPTSRPPAVTTRVSSTPPWPTAAASRWSRPTASARCAPILGAAMTLSSRRGLAGRFRRCAPRPHRGLPDVQPGPRAKGRRLRPRRRLHHQPRTLLLRGRQRRPRLDPRAAQGRRARRVRQRGRGPRPFPDRCLLRCLRAQTRRLRRHRRRQDRQGWRPGSPAATNCTASTR